MIKLKDILEEMLSEACWDGYRQVGMKKKGNRMVPNCVRIKEEKKNKIKKAYLTKDAGAMRKEIDRVKKLKSDDPSATESGTLITLTKKKQRNTAQKSLLQQPRTKKDSEKKRV